MIDDLDDEKEDDYLSREEARYNGSSQTQNNDQNHYENRWHHMIEVAHDLVKANIEKDSPCVQEKIALQRKAIKLIKGWMDACMFDSN